MVNDYLIVQGWGDTNEDHELHVARCLNMRKWTKKTCSI
jgi:hypothetical protein